MIKYLVIYMSVFIISIVNTTTYFATTQNVKVSMDTIVSSEEEATYGDFLTFIDFFYKQKNNESPTLTYEQTQEASSILIVGGYNTLYPECVEAGIVEGVEITQEKWNEKITREDIAVILANILKLQNEFHGITPGARYHLYDMILIPEHKRTEALSLYSMGIIRSIDGLFRPKKTATHNDITTMIEKTFYPEKRDAIQVNSFYIPVIMYHSIGNDPNFYGDYIISKEQFKEDLEYLKEHNYTSILMSDLIAFVNHGTPLPQKPIMITFDDGYADNFSNGFPLLQEYNTKAIISPITSFYGKDVDIKEEYLTLEQARIMQESGLVEIQNHSYDLHDIEKRSGVLRKLSESNTTYETIFSQDLQKVKQFYESNHLIVPNTFVYPYGKDSKGAETIIKNAGLIATLDTYPEQLNTISIGDADSLYGIHRFNRPTSITTGTFFYGLEWAGK